jgi:hypothetical protein
VGTSTTGVVRRRRDLVGPHLTVDEQVEAAAAAVARHALEHLDHPDRAAVRVLVTVHFTHSDGSTL